MNSYEQGNSAGRNGSKYDANPYAADSNDSACWLNGWSHGRYAAAAAAAVAASWRIEKIFCPTCEAVGERVFLRDGSHIWDPDCDIGGYSDPDPDLPAPDGKADRSPEEFGTAQDDPESLICHACHTPFDHRPYDHYANYPQPDDLYYHSVTSLSGLSPASPTERGTGLVYVVRSSDRIRIGKASSPRRYESYKRALPHGCEVLKVWQVSQPLSWESYLHTKYRNFRKHGSWYEIPEIELRELLMLQPPEAK